MFTMKKILFLFAVLISVSVFASSAQDAKFNQLADEYFDTYYLPMNPTTATQLGVHQYDDQLEDYSRSSVNKVIRILKQFAQQVDAIDPVQLSEQARGDRELILSDIKSQLLMLEVIRPWQKNPDYYVSGLINNATSGGIANSAFVIMERRYASVNDRLRALVEREKKMPAVLDEARKNLNNPPRIYTEITIEQLPGVIDFFKKDVPLAFADATDPALKKSFAQSNAAVVAALQSYQTWLKTSLLPHSHGSFRLGADTFKKKLQYDEMVDLPLNRLLSIGMTNLRENQRAYQQTMRELAKGSSVEKVKAAVDANHPEPDQMLNAFSSSFDSLITFIKDHNIITIPSDVRPIMENTPPFMRAATFASMDTAGPFETTATESYFNVTLPDPAWSKAKISDYMSMFNYPAIIGTAIHEAYPGHYTQFLWMHNMQDRTRKILGVSSNTEGWAHYCEQMMLDEGYGQSGNSRDARLLRLGQLQNALMRNARYIVAIKMHTGNMTVNQAINFFVKEGFQSRSTGIVESKRATLDPTYLYYTLGKLQIMKLRADLQAKEGKSFSLRQFHDDFMRQGHPPVKIVRQSMLKDDSPTL